MAGVMKSVLLEIDIFVVVVGYEGRKSRVDPCNAAPEEEVSIVCMVLVAMI